MLGHAANIPPFLHMKEMYFLLSPRQHFLLLSGSSVLFKNSTSFSKQAQKSQALSPDCSSPAVYGDVMVRCYFPLALLEITACDCDKWIFPLNSLVEWGIQANSLALSTQVKHWVIFFLVSKEVKRRKQRGQTLITFPIFLCCMHYDSRILQLFL